MILAHPEFGDYDFLDDFHKKHSEIPMVFAIPDIPKTELVEIFYGVLKHKYKGTYFIESKWGVAPHTVVNLVEYHKSKIIKYLT